MRLQTITYRGRPVACATATRFFLSDDLERLPAGDPLLTFVLYMCAYAHDVLTDQLGPYTDDNALRFARAALVPEELADPDRIAHTQRNLQQTAHALKLPAAELAAALADIAPAATLQPQSRAATRRPTVRYARHVHGTTVASGASRWTRRWPCPPRRVQ